MVVFNSLLLLLVGKVKMILSDNGVKDCEHLNGAQTQPGRNIWRQSESQRASQAWTPGAGVRQNWKPKMISLTVTIIPIGIVIILTSDPVCYLWSLSHTSLSVCCCRSSRSHTLQLSPDQYHASSTNADADGRGASASGDCGWLHGNEDGTGVSKVTLLESLGECPSYFGLCSCWVGTHASPGKTHVMNCYQLLHGIYGDNHLSDIGRVRPKLGCEVGPVVHPEYLLSGWWWWGGCALHMRAFYNDEQASKAWRAW